MINKIYQFIEKYQMLADTDLVIVGLSGGADSVCLLTVLNQIKQIYHMPFTLLGVHVNHMIRGEEALRDQQFSEELCHKFGVPFLCRTVDVPAMAQRLGMSEEEAGRKARYDIFTEIARVQEGHAVIAVAHHKNDQAETVMMNLFRGSGLKGLSGMQPARIQNGAMIIRPLLGVTRGEIEQYLKDQGQSYITDSTNLEAEYTRNKLRNELIPYLRDNFNPNIVSTICDMAENLSRAEVYIENQAVTLYRSVVTYTGIGRERAAIINTDLLADTDPFLLSYIMKKVIIELSGAARDIYRSHIEGTVALVHQQVGKKVTLPYGLVAVRQYHAVRIGFAEQNCVTNPDAGMDSFLIRIETERINQLQYGESITVPVMQYIFTEDRGSIYVENIQIEMVKSLENSLNNVYTKYFDYDKIKSNIYLRFRRTGDSIVIQANGASRKFKKELIDRKIPLENRDKILLLTDEEHILWAIGIRRGEDNRVEDDTRRILKISVELQEE